MAIDNSNYGVAFRAPALPYAPEEYNQQQFEQFNNVLRLYFKQLDTAIRNATVSDRAEAVGWFLS
tara:strand:+ start:3013 stop:3207 length:195 start_codon:yes stop_codon:yes gene_type:complete